MPIELASPLYTIYDAQGFRRGTFNGSIVEGEKLATCLQDLGANPGEKWFASLHPADPDFPSPVLHFLTYGEIEPDPVHVPTVEVS